MSRSSRGNRSAPARGPRKPATLAERIAWLRRLEAGLFASYVVDRLRIDHRMQAFAWRVRVTVPVYEESFDLRIELEERRSVRVTVEGWSGPMKHSYGSNRLCMWHPDDPPDRQWQRGDGLLKLVDTSVTHLFKELYFRETGDWPGEEAPHAAPKIEPRSLLGFDAA